MIVLIYRRLIESGDDLQPFKETNKCIVCNATAEDLVEQAELMSDSE